MADRSRLAHVVAVTGSQGVIGGAICSALSARGDVVIGVDQAEGADLVVDVGTAEGNQAVVDFALARHGRLDGLVLNAGVQHVAPIAEFAEEAWDRLMAVMAKGPYLALKAAWSSLAASGSGRVVVVASTSSFLGEPGKVAYTAAKHAVMGIVKVAAIEGAAAGIAVNAVAPGWTLTPLVEAQVVALSVGRLRSEVEQEMLGRQADPQFVAPDAIARVVAMLMDPTLQGVTGTCVPIDRGMLAC